MPPTRRSKKPYHHGDLCAALLDVAWTIVKEDGMAALTLRACARRADVSHAAPIHHFTSVAGKLAELAADGYERLASAMDAAAIELPDEPLRAAGIGYIRFAAEHPEHFRLMSTIKVPHGESTRLHQAAMASRSRLENALQSAHLRAHGSSLSKDELAIRTALAWCSVHGFATLSSDGAAAKSRMPDPDVFLAHLCDRHLSPSETETTRHQFGSRGRDFRYELMRSNGMKGKDPK